MPAKVPELVPCRVPMVVVEIDDRRQATADLKPPCSRADAVLMDAEIITAWRVAVTVWSSIVASLCYLAFAVPRRRIAIAARVSLVAVAIATIVLLWLGYEFSRNFTIPPM